MLGLGLPMPTDLRHESRANHLQIQSDEDMTSMHSSSWTKRGITNLTVETPTRPRFAVNELIGLERARWKTPEFIVYGVIVAAALQLMARVPMRLSDSTFTYSRDIRTHVFGILCPKVRIPTSHYFMEDFHMAGYPVVLL